MKEIELASQVDLTLHLGLMAIAITLILWRVSDSKQVYDQIKAFHEYCRSGYANSAIIKELRFKWFQVYLKIITIFVSLGIFHFSFKYLKILERMVGPESVVLDYGILSSLWHQSEKITQSNIILCIVFFLLVFIDYILTFKNESFSRICNNKNPKRPHAYIILKEERLNIKYMWRKRLQEINEVEGMDLNTLLKENDWNIPGGTIYQTNLSQSFKLIFNSNKIDLF